MCQCIWPVPQFAPSSCRSLELTCSSLNDANFGHLPCINAVCSLFRFNHHHYHVNTFHDPYDPHSNILPYPFQISATFQQTNLPKLRYVTRHTIILQPFITFGSPSQVASTSRKLFQYVRTRNVTFHSLSLSLSLSHTHTHTHTKVKHIFILRLRRFWCDVK